MSRFTAQKVFYISLEPETRVQPWPCLLRGRKPRDLVEGQNPLPEMRTEQPVQNLPLSSNTPFSGLSFLPVSQEPSPLRALRKDICPPTGLRELVGACLSSLGPNAATVGTSLIWPRQVHSHLQ